MDSTVVKAIAVLETLANSSKPIRITDLARDLNLAKSNAHRLLKTLEALGYVRQRSEDAMYEASLRLWEVGVQVLSRLDVQRVARPWLEALAEECRETVHLSRYDDGHALYLDKIESSHPVRAYTQVGGRSPAYATATGKALLAYQSDETISAVCKHLKGFTPKTLIDPGKLRAHLALVRREGFAMNRGEWREEVLGLGAPIFNEKGHVIAAVGISGIVARLRGPALRATAPAVMRTASEISRELGYSSPKNNHLSEHEESAEKLLRKHQSRQAQLSPVI